MDGITGPHHTTQLSHMAQSSRLVHADGHTPGPPLDSGAKLSEGHGGSPLCGSGDVSLSVHGVWNGKQGG